MAKRVRHHRRLSSRRPLLAGSLALAHGVRSCGAVRSKAALSSLRESLRTIRELIVERGNYLRQLYVVCTQVGQLAGEAGRGASGQLSPSGIGAATDADSSQKVRLVEDAIRATLLLGRVLLVDE